MECRNIRDRLSAYMDDVLSPEERAAVEEHLKLCRGCAAALADLRKTVEHLKGLETVEPPLWMTEKVMARVRAETGQKKSLFQKLFFPLHIKLPIEAVATVLVIGLALYIYHDIVPEVRLAKAPIEESAPQAFPEEQQHMPVPSPLHLDEGKSEKPSAKGGDGRFVGKREPVPEKPAEHTPAWGEGEMKAEGQAKSNIQEPERRAVVKVPAPVKSLEQAPAAGAVAKEEARQETGAAAPKAKLSYMKHEEKALSVTVLVKDPAAAAGEIEETLKELEGKMIHTESAEGKKVITSTMAAGKARQLFRKLKSIGDIGEKELDLKGQEGDIILRVEVIKNP